MRYRSRSRARLRWACSSVIADTAVPGVGTDAWQLLWKAARDYGDSVGHPWPPKHDEAACVLCHQPLNDAAHDRLADFEAFFASSIETQVRATERACEARRETLPDLDQLAARHAPVLDALGRARGQLGERLAIWVAEATAQREKLIAGDQDGLTGVEAPPFGLLEQWASDRDKEASRHAELEEPAEQRRIRSELQELDARAALAERLDETLGWLRATNDVHQFRQAHAKLHTGTISRKQSELAAALITEELEAELRRQLKALKFIQIEVVSCRSKTERGKPQVKLKLKTTHDASLRQVLCDGEQGRLALAMFLAEAVVANDGHPIVLDDPVSSIDHDGRRHIARTLVELAKRRQVIIFTHDMVFIGDLQRRAHVEKLPVREQAVYRIGRVTGHVAEELPWAGQSVEKRIGTLKSRLHKLDALDRRGDDPVGYREQGEQFCNYLRQAFERAVEDKLLGAVITRRDPGVHISQLDRVVCTEQTATLANRGLDESSPWMHDRSRAENDPPPTVDELREGLKLLQKLVAAAEQTKRTRRQLAAEGRDQLQLAADLGRDAA